MNLNHVREAFIALYGAGPLSSFHSPGRINLIGEHVDYNGGTVFPAALTLGTVAVARKRPDTRLRLASASFGGEVITLDLDSVAYNREHHWVNYPLGVIDEFQKLGIDLGGLDILIASDLPSDAGLSSSASIELLMSVILNTFFDCKLPMIEMVKLSQRAENRFVGVNCGIMDQFAIGMGKKDMGMLLNCTDLACEYIPVLLDEYSLVIGNTNSPRGLADSKYNERRAECDKALAMLAPALDITRLGDMSPEAFEANRHLITDPTISKRAEHVIYEIKRTKEAAERLSMGDLEAFGRLMNDSHDSLANLYEVTGPALDTMVAAARKQAGVLGSRMTGAGFGGCTLSLVQQAHIGTFVQQVGREYREKTGAQADFYIAGIGDGTREVG